MNNVRGIGALTVFAAVLVAYGVINRFTTAHVVLVSIVFILSAIPRSRWIGMALVPASIFILAYDLLRVFAERAIHIVVVKGIYDLELALFGIERDGVLLTPNEWIAAYLNTPMDLLGGLVYSTHIPPLLAVAIWLMWRSRKLEVEDRAAIGAFFWGLCILNLVAYTTMFLMPVAPPWYVEAYGLSPPPEVIIGNPARLARVDLWLGNDYFTSVYAQGAYTFGAVPSLHTAYPIFAALHLGKRPAAIPAWTWATLMMFYAVYTNHHYILDVVAGAGLAIGIWAVFGYTPVRDWFRKLYDWQLGLFPVGSRDG